MGRLKKSCLIAAALAAAGPVFAQSASPTEEGGKEIVVTGTREREQQVSDFVRALTPARSGSIPRFIDAVCPTVTGLAPTQRDLVVTRLRKVASGAGLPVAPRDCVPNVFVIVTNDKRAFIELLAAKRPYSFGMMTARQIQRLARTPGPAAAWQLEGPVSSSGVPLQWDSALNTYVNRTTEGASRLRSTSGTGFDAAALVVEQRALDGLTATQLADYAAMRLLAKLDPAQLPAQPPATILTALTAPVGSPVALTVTKWDLGFLRGLYASSINVSPTSRRSQILDQVKREAERIDQQQD